MPGIRKSLRLAAVLALALGLTPSAGFAETTLRFIPQADLRSVDPIWTTAYVTRNFGYLVFDTLFALDTDFKPQPQMVDSWKASDDKAPSICSNPTGADSTQRGGFDRLSTDNAIIYKGLGFVKP